MNLQAEADRLRDLRRASHNLFGNQDRLAVFAAVGEADPADLYGDALAYACGIDKSRVSKQLKVLESTGLLIRLPKAGGERRQYFTRTTSSIWLLAIGLRDELLGQR